MRDRTAQTADPTAYEVIMPDGSIRIAQIRDGRIERDTDRECGRCLGSGFAPMVQRGRRVAGACPECIVGAVRAKALGIPYAPDGEWVGPLADACHPSHPERLAEIARAKALLTASRAARVSDYIHDAERMVAEGADPHELARRMWWLPDRARSAIRAMGFAIPEEDLNDVHAR